MTDREKVAVLRDALRVAERRFVAFARAGMQDSVITDMVDVRDWGRAASDTVRRALEMARDY